MPVAKKVNSIIVVRPEVVRHFGATTAAFLSQLNYWITVTRSGIIHNGKRWVFNTAEQWSKQIGVSDRQIRRIVASLRDAGVLLVAKLADYKSNRTNYYTINYERLNQLFEQLKIPQDTLSVSVCTRQDVLMVKTKNTNRDCNISEKANKKENYEPQEDKQELSISQCIPSNEVPATESNANIVHDMVNYWNATFPNSQTALRRDLVPLLLSALKRKFNSEIIKWKHYCKVIASSSYITSQNFKLSIYWALKYGIIDRINAGEFGVKPLPFITDEQALMREMYKDICQLSESEKCKEVRLKLLKVYGVFAYKHWFKTLKFFVSQDKITYIAPSKFHEDFIAREYRDILNQI
ncbi:DnaA N-terminal domain-containing protein [Candidatus Odyssella thessalonicensis]|uniref:DnaA N-terminal domain-containing protein n=1 Tax=Candidatus Odyssella thessalonicensis TaxID=84647 RepID=UPI000225AF58|nr:DnaA N-terminal domain-containing protein [Candidatus Odyssella thessalonicensis]